MTQLTALQILLDRIAEGNGDIYPNSVREKIEENGGDPWGDAAIAAAAQLGVKQVRYKFDGMAPQVFEIWAWVVK